MHIYLLIGQSNMAGRGVMVEGDDAPVANVVRLNEQEEWEPAGHPLHRDLETAGVGVGIDFARRMLEQGDAASIGLVPCAVGGTPLSRWVKGADLYEEAIRRTKIAMQHGPLNGALWHQGESDTGTTELADSYAARLDRMISDLRADLDAPHLPFIVGELCRVEPQHSLCKYGDTVNAALKSLPDRVPDTGWVSSEGLTHKGDYVHFNADSLRRLGRRYAEQLILLQAVATSNP